MLNSTMENSPDDLLNLNLEDLIALMELQAKESNESILGFPQRNYFGIPPDQKEKLLEMHKASGRNAAIYISVVLGIYFVLLALLLCRYVKCRRGSDEALLTLPPVPPRGREESTSGVFYCFGCWFKCFLTPSRVTEFFRRMCYGQTPVNIEESFEEEIPMTSLNTQVEIRGILKNKNEPVPV